MGIRFARDKDTGESGKRQILITASPAACSGLAVVTLLCFVWVFVFGLIIGRGYQPEEIVPELKQFMPVAKGPATSSNQTGLQQMIPAENKTRDIIKAEELNFYEQLKKSPTPRTVSKTKTATPITKSTQPPAPIASSAIPKLPSGAQSFDYVYQAAASQDLKAAEALKAKIEAKGFKSRIESAVSGGATWHRVMVLFRGTPQSTSQLKASLSELGIAKPLLKSKTAL